MFQASSFNLQTYTRGPHRSASNNKRCGSVKLAKMLNDVATNTVTLVTTSSCSYQSSDMVCMICSPKSEDFDIIMSKMTFRRKTRLYLLTNA